MSKIVIESKMMSSPEEFDEAVKGILDRSSQQNQFSFQTLPVLVQKLTNFRLEWEEAMDQYVDEIACPSLGAVLRDICEMLGLSASEIAAIVGEVIDTEDLL